MHTTSTLDAATLEKLIAAAVAAPSLHNMQPWRYRLDPDTATIEVRAATERSLRHTDPLGRALHVSVGAAVLNLRIAVAHFGWEPVVRLLPRPAEPDLLASVRLAGPLPGGSRHGQELYDAVWRRHSSRVPFSGRALPAEVLAELIEAAVAEGADLVVPGVNETRRILQLTSEAEWFTATDPARRAENRRWVRDGASDGMPGAVLGPRDASGHLPVRDFSALRPAYARPAAAFEARPVIAVLSTRHDRRADWLRAGQALENVLLTATIHRVRASMLHQALEWPDIRWALRDPRSGTGHVQMLIRLGYGPDGPASPRRPLSDVLDSGPQR
ncbi:Acg family FMN-binding oxidoreductase [Streptomyces sp. NPDC049040]|uniref:Acg family FMN-binding oxidoreductase n=1 Tax=Streptomyces sp. NPDC049040 TaxID=3365593 RepID=UPI003720FE8B